MQYSSMDSVINALEKTHFNEDASSGVTFEGKNLKWDSAADAKSLVDAINACKNLEYLNLAGNTLGVAAAETISKALEKHPEFKRALWKDLFTGRLKTEIPKALQHLGEGLVGSGARLTILDLSDNAFGPIGVKGLASLLRSSSCYNLKELRLNNNGLGISGGKLLANALLDCYNNSKACGSPLALQVFIAGRNRLENEGAKALAEVFKTIGTFEEIAMPQNGIYHVGITALSEAFAMNPNLKVLNLNDNTISPKGAAALSRALPNLQKLISINFGDCLLKTKGAVFIADALREKHQLLEEINMDFNEIRAEGGLAVARAVRNKLNLKSLMLDGNWFGAEGKEQVLDELRGCGKFDALGTLDENESEQSDDGEDEASDDEDQEENEDEETLDEEDLDEYEIQCEQSVPTVKASDFIECPTAEKFLALGENRTNLLLDEFKGVSDEVYLDKCVPVLMKVSSLAGSGQPEVSAAAVEASVALYKSLFEWAQRTEQTSLLNNALLVHLGLIKCEDKKYRPPWDVDGCMLSLESAVKQQFFLQSTKDTLRVFLDSDGGDRRNIEDFLISGVQALALQGDLD